LIGLLLSFDCCRKRETLTGDATVRYFDYLEDFASFDGILPNLFTEVSNSTERSFNAVDFVDTPGLVDGDMKVGERGGDGDDGVRF
jgi:hypothetical protein